MANNTKGKWEFREGRAEYNEMSRIVRQDDEEFLIGYVICEGNNQSQRKEDLANARLIAAAPELLEALRLVIEAKRQPIVDEESRIQLSLARSEFEVILKAYQTAIGG